MSNFCHPTPPDKKAYISNIGRTLVKDYGKQKFYKPEQVKTAAKKNEYRYTSLHSVDWYCWAMCVFSSPIDFNTYHLAIGDVCDYVEMKKEMLGAFLVDIDWLTLPDFDFNMSWVDIGDFFSNFEELGESIAEGIGNIFSGLFDL